MLEQSGSISGGGPKLAANDGPPPDVLAREGEFRASTCPQAGR